MTTAGVRFTLLPFWGCILLPFLGFWGLLDFLLVRLLQVPGAFDFDFLQPLLILPPHCRWRP